MTLRGAFTPPTLTETTPLWQSVAAMISAMFLAQLHSAVFGPLSPDDKSRLSTELSGSLFQVATAMLFFREPVGLKTLTALMPSLALKWFKDTVSLRLDGKRRVKHPKKLKALVIVLHVCFMAWFQYWYVRIFSTHGLSPLTLALAAEIAFQWGDLLERTFGELLSPENPGGLTILVTAYLAIMRVFIYFAMSMLLLSKWYLPAHIARDAYTALRHMVRSMRVAVSYRRGTISYGLKYATHSDILSAPSSDCPICFENLNEAVSVKTVCGHNMHLSCISSWLKLNAVCPICRQTQAPKPLAPRELAELAAFEVPVAAALSPTVPIAVMDDGQ